MHYRITLYEKDVGTKRGMSKVKGAVYVEGDLTDATEAAHIGAGRMGDKGTEIARIVIDANQDPPEGSDPFAAVGGTDATEDDEKAATDPKAK